MSFNLATAFVELQAKGFNTVTGAIEGVKSKLGGLSGAASFDTGFLDGMKSKLGSLSEVRNSLNESLGKLDFGAKAGAVGAVAVASFEVGKAIGGWVFETDKWEQSLETGRKKLAELGNEVRSVMDKSFKSSMGDIELIRDPDKKRAAYESLMSQLRASIKGTESAVRAGRKEVEDWNAAWQITGNRKAFAQMAKDQLDEDEKKLKSLQSQREAIENIAGARAKELEQRKRANAMAEKADSAIESLKGELAMLKANTDERYKLKAAMLDPGGKSRSQIETLLREADAIKEKTAAQEKANAEQQRVANSISGEESKIRQQRIELEGGKQAAEEYRLVQMGISEELARSLAMQQAAIDAEKQKATTAERVADAIRSERDRQKEQMILLKQGKEAAHAYRLEKQGIDSDTAKQLASEQTALEAMSKSMRQVGGFSDLAGLADKMQERVFGAKTSQAQKKTNEFEQGAAEMRLAFESKPTGIPSIDSRIAGSKPGSSTEPRMATVAAASAGSSAAARESIGRGMSAASESSSKMDSLQRQVSLLESLLSLAQGQGFKVVMPSGGEIKLPATNVQFGKQGE